MNTMIYSIPLQRLDASGAKHVIIRSADVPALVSALSAENPERIISVQIAAAQANTEALNAWGIGLPIELILNNPGNEFPSLYRHVNLLDQHPVWILIPVIPGFSKAVKLALALNFAVRLELGQPDADCIVELLEVLDFYLHQSSVAQPIDFVQGVLLGFYYGQPNPLWVIFDEQPNILRYVDDDGRETLAGRLAAAEINLPADADLTSWIDQFLAAAADCQNCVFRQSCGGYFKWPHSDYDCAGVKQLFSVLHDAAEELRSDLQEAPS